MKTNLIAMANVAKRMYVVNLVKLCVTCVMQEYAGKKSVDDMNLDGKRTTHKLHKFHKHWNRTQSLDHPCPMCP